MLYYATWHLLQEQESSPEYIWMVNICFFRVGFIFSDFHDCLGKIPILKHIPQMGWLYFFGFSRLFGENSHFETYSSNGLKTTQLVSNENPAPRSRSSRANFVCFDFNTVDGRNPAPVSMEDITFFIGFNKQQVVSRISEPSTVSLFASKKE